MKVAYVDVQLWKGVSFRLWKLHRLCSLCKVSKLCKLCRRLLDVRLLLATGVLLLFNARLWLIVNYCREVLG